MLTSFILPHRSIGCLHPEITTLPWRQRRRDNAESRLGLERNREITTRGRAALLQQNPLRPPWLRQVTKKERAREKREREITKTMVIICAGKIPFEQKTHPEMSASAKKRHLNPGHCGESSRNQTMSRGKVCQEGCLVRIYFTSSHDRNHVRSEHEILGFSDWLREV